MQKWGHKCEARAGGRQEVGAEGRKPGSRVPIPFRWGVSWGSDKKKIIGDLSVYVAFLSEWKELESQDNI